MLICRMWLGGIIVLAIWSVGTLAAESIAFATFAGEDGSISEIDAENASLAYDAGYAAIWLVLSLIVGIKGNPWRQAVLRKRGFTHVKSVQAQSADAAVAEVSAGEKAAEAASP